MWRYVRILVPAALLALSSAAATAQVMRATITGTVGPIVGYDTTGVFGQPATDLLGLPFILAVTFDLSLGQRNLLATSDSLQGGPALGYSDPILDTALTINGATVHVPISGHVVIELSSNAFDINIQSRDPGLVKNHVTMFLASPTSSFSTSLSSGFGPVPVTGGEDFLIRTDSATGGASLIMAEGQLVGKSMWLESVTPAVPEPASAYVFALALPIIATIARRRSSLETDPLRRSAA